MARLLPPEKKEHRKNHIDFNLLQCPESHADFNSINTGDELWAYDPETKAQLSVWMANTQESSLNSQQNLGVAVIFDQDVIVHHKYYLQVLRRLQIAVCRK